jgi:zinc/manganese transport system permease protein
MHQLLIAPFAEFEFMRRALVGVLALALSAAPVGVFLMLRRMSLTGDAGQDGVRHGVAVAFLLAGTSVVAMTAGGLAAGVAVALMSGALARSTALGEDATLAAFYLVSLAAGVMLVSSRGSSIDLFHVLFGNVLALDDAALLILGGAATVTLLALAILYRPLVLDTVDKGYLATLGQGGAVAHFAFLALVVVNLVAAFQAFGTLLGVGAMVLPAVAARFWSADVNRMIPIAVGLGLASGAAGLLVSFHADLETGPTVTLAGGAAALVSALIGPAGGLLRRRPLRRHLEA